MLNTYLTIKRNWVYRVVYVHSLWKIFFFARQFWVYIYLYTWVQSHVWQMPTTHSKILPYIGNIKWYTRTYINIHSCLLTLFLSFKDPIRYLYKYKNVGLMEDNPTGHKVVIKNDSGHNYTNETGQQRLEFLFK